MTYEEVVELLLRDVERTLGASAGQEAAAFARLERRLGNVRDDQAESLVDSVQTYIHDCFIDPTWPACPIHGYHPLWFGRDDAWWCTSDDVKVAALGSLPARAD